MQVSDVIKMECIDLNHEGLGVCKVDGFLVFVEDMLIGEVGLVKIQKMEKSFARGYVIEMKKSSNDRVKPICRNYYSCGGCHLMHLSYPKQLEFKKKMVEETFKRIGHLDIKVDEIVPMKDPYYYRNKIQVPFGMKKDKVICGFYKKKTNDIIPLEECYIEPKLATDIVRFVKNLCNELKIDAYDKINKKGSMRHVLIRKNNKDEYMLVIITKTEELKNRDKLVEKITSRYPQVKSIIHNVNYMDNNIVLGPKYKCIYGEEVLIEELCGLKFELSHNAFFQTNHEQTEKLYQIAIEFLNPKNYETIIDAYCGVGTISLLVATKAKKVYGIEIVEEAIVNAKKNAKLNNIENVEFVTGASEKVILDFSDKKIDALVVDPPRKGCERTLLDAILLKEIERIVYVSCDVATLARDLNILSEKYDVIKCKCVDLFPMTSHVETITLLSLKEPKSSKN